MSPDVFGDRKLYAWLLGGAFLAFLLIKLLACGGTRGPARDAARITRFTVEANCADLTPVVDCLAQIDERAKEVDELLDRAVDELKHDGGAR